MCYKKIEAVADEPLLSPLMASYYSYVAPFSFLLSISINPNTQPKHWYAAAQSCKATWFGLAAVLLSKIGHGLYIVVRDNGQGHH